MNVGAQQECLLQKLFILSPICIKESEEVWVGLRGCGHYRSLAEKRISYTCCIMINSIQ